MAHRVCLQSTFPGLAGIETHRRLEHDLRLIRVIALRFIWMTGTSQRERSISWYPDECLHPSPVPLRSVGPPQEQRNCSTTMETRIASRYLGITSPGSPEVRQTCENPMHWRSSLSTKGASVVRKGGAKPNRYRCGIRAWKLRLHASRQTPPQGAHM